MRCESIAAHYQSQWKNTGNHRTWNAGPTSELPPDFTVLEFPPHADRTMWTYATCCMSHPSQTSPIELHIFSPYQSESLIELLTVIAHYHANHEPLDVGHTVNFGRPWLDSSECKYGLISLPYLDGPNLEKFQPGEPSEPVRCLWLIPITHRERDYKAKFGLTALEEAFEKAGFNYLDVNRRSVI